MGAIQAIKLTAMTIPELKNKILNGDKISKDEALSLCEMAQNNHKELWDAAEEITRAFVPAEFDSCSIINARSGKCPENCKWCAQSAHYKTKIETYPLVGREECMRMAELNRKAGIKRFSLVASGRKMQGKDLDTICDYYREMRKAGGLKLCASLGLMEREDLQKLFDAGVTRYHCNLEASPTFFPTLCSTHTVEDKIRTILMAKEIGFEICSGGIIGMGETARQRIELAIELLRIDPASIPINVLCPIPGTPLENSTPLTDEEILDTISFFRFIHPDKTLRFAGGRAKMSRETQLKAMRIGVNGAIMGDMLTTVGSLVNKDKEMIEASPYSY